MLTAVCRTLIHILVTHVSGESSSGTVAVKTPRAHLAVWTAAKALRSLADFVVVGADQGDVGTRTGAQVVADGAVLAGRAGTSVDRRFTATTGISRQTATVERLDEILTDSGVETCRRRTIINISFTVATYTDRITTIV